MGIADIEFKFEINKRKVLARIQNLTEEWQAAWDRCQGNPEAEALAIEAKLKIQLLGTEWLDELNSITEEIKKVKDNN